MSSVLAEDEINELLEGCSNKKLTVEEIQNDLRYNASNIVELLSKYSKTDSIDLLFDEVKKQILLKLKENQKSYEDFLKLEKMITGENK